MTDTLAVIITLVLFASIGNQIGSLCYHFANKEFKSRVHMLYWCVPIIPGLLHLLWVVIFHIIYECILIGTCSLVRYSYRYWKELSWFSSKNKGTKDDS